LFFLPKTLGKPVPQTIEEVIGGDAYQPVKNQNEQNPTTVCNFRCKALQPNELQIVQNKSFLLQ